VRYIVIQVALRPFEDPIVEVEDILTAIDATPVLCATWEQAQEAILAARADPDMDWSVWEIVDGRAVRRAVVLASGRPEISSG
jgi:hypothetical protein